MQREEGGLGVWHCDMAQTRKAAVTQFHMCHASTSLSLALRAHFYVWHSELFLLCCSVTRRRPLIRCENGPELPLHVGKEQHRVWPSHTLNWWTSVSWWTIYLYSFIVSIDTARYLTPTGLHKVVLLPGTQVHTYTNANTLTFLTIPLPFLTLPQVLLQINAYFMSELFKSTRILFNFKSSNKPNQALCWYNYIEFCCRVN